MRLIYAALAKAGGPTIGAWEVGAELGRESPPLLGARTEEMARILAQGEPTATLR
jgi:hypothetical protein